MKNFSFLLCLAILTLAYLRASGQRILFSDTTNSWRTKFVAYPDGPPGSTIISDYQMLDTTISWNGKEYHLLDYEAGVLVREDTQARKVYIKPLAAEQVETRFRPTDTNEFVYFDYNLEVGDTLIMPYITAYPTAIDSFSYHVVQAVDSVLIDNLFYKTLFINAYFSNHPWPTHYEVVEGAGTNTGPIFIPYGLGEWSTDLICFQSRDTTPHNRFSSCSPISVKELNDNPGMLRIFPNPTNGKVSVQFSKPVTGTFTIDIINLSGQVMHSAVFRKETEIDLTHLAPGLYFARLHKDGVLLQSNKLVIAR